MLIKVCCPFHSNFDLLKPALRELFLCKEHTFLMPDSLSKEQSHGFRQSGVPRWARNHGINDGKSIDKFQKLPDEIDAYLMLDTDILFCLDSVLRLIKNDKDVCVAPYATRSNMLEYECGMFGEIIGDKANKFSVYEHGVKKVDWAGAGFMLIKRPVFEKLEYPWFRQNLIVCGEQQEECSEDIGFCMGLKESGIELWCDFGINIVHAPRPDFIWNIWAGATPEQLKLLKAHLSEKKKEAENAVG